MKRSTLITIVLVSMGALLVPTRAWAHKIKIFAAADGSKIEGYAYVPGGGRIRRGTVEVWVSENQKAATLALNNQGEFSYTAKQRCDHRLVLKLEDGHTAAFTVSAAELPDRLPAAGSAVGEGPAHASEPQDAAAPATALASGSPFASEIHQLRQQVIQLRQQVDAYQERLSFQDIIGGVGYILGIAGIAFYMLGKRRNRHS